MLRILLGIVLFCLSSIAKAQPSTIKCDTLTNGDTIIIYQSPLVISKKVYVEEPTSNFYKRFIEISTSWGIQILNQISQQELLNKVQSKATPNSMMASAKLFFQFHSNWHLGLGLSLIHHTARLNYQWQHPQTLVSTNIKSDTIDEYIVTNPTTFIDSTIYVIEQNPYLEQQTISANTNIKSTQKAIFVELPIELKYMIRKTKYSIAFLGFILPSYLIHNNSSESILNQNAKFSERKQSLNSLNFSIGFGTELGLPILSNLDLFSQITYRKELMSYTKDTAIVDTHRNLVLATIGIRRYLH